MRASKRVRQRRRNEAAEGMVARAYVTTYGVGNNRGFATGKWFDLTKYSSQREFYAAADHYAMTVLGDDDPELAFPDYECSFGTEGLMSESEISQGVWDILNSDIDKDDLEMLAAYRECQGMGSRLGFSELLDAAHDAYVGHFRNDREMAEEYVDSMGYLEDVDDLISYNVNYDGVAHELMMNMMSHNGYYFNSL